MWDSIFGKSPIIVWLKNQIDLLWQSVTGGDPPNLEDKVNSPETFTEGHFASYNATSNTLDDSGKSPDNYLEKEEGKGWSTNDFDNDYKTILDNLPENIAEFNQDFFMAAIEPTAGNLGDILTLDAIGQPEASGKKSDGIWSNYSVNMGSEFIAYSVDTITVGALHGAKAICTLGLQGDYSRTRITEFLITLDGINEPDYQEGFSAARGNNDFDGDITFSVVDGNLRASYTRVDGDDNANFLSVKILTL